MAINLLIEKFGRRLNEKELIYLADHYYDFAQLAFNTLFNDMYSSDKQMAINCIFVISAQDSNGVYGKCTKGTIILYLFEIMKKVPNRAIYAIIISVLAHELKHLNQHTPINHNYSDEEVTKYIENPNDWETLQYLTERREYLESEIGVNFNMLAYKHIDLSRAIYETNMYKDITDKEYWIYILCRLYIIKESVGKWKDSLIDNMDKYPFINLTLDIDANSRVYYPIYRSIKIDNKYVQADDTLLWMVYNINKLDSVTFSVKVSSSENELDNTTGSLDILFKYSNLKCMPLIKYDDKPCAP